MDALKTKRVMNEMKTRVPHNNTLAGAKIETQLSTILSLKNLLFCSTN